MTLLQRPRHSIRAKLALMVAASVGAAVLLAFGVGGYREIERFAEAKRSELQATAEVLARSAAEPLVRGDEIEARQVLNAIARLPGIRFAEIADANGNTIAEAGMGVALGTGPVLQDDAGPSLWAMLRQGSLYVSVDIVKGGNEVGRLGLLVDTSDVADRLKQAVIAALISAFIAALIGFLVAWRMQRSITHPLRDLTEAMNRVRLTSDFGQRAPRQSADETGQLVDAFNDMLDQIQRRDTALEEHRAGLERTVAERTHDLAEARDVAESANRAKSDFLATMSHEIRTPMNGMLVMAELLAGTELPVRQQRYAETIVRSGQTLLTIINDILDLSKIEAGKLELERGRAAIGTIVDDVLGLFWEKASSKGIDLAAHIGADVPELIEGDPVRLSQILSNLVNNALKFTESGYVKVVIEREGDRGSDVAQLRFRVEDTGIGISAENLGRLFQAFSQAEQSTTRRFGGTGLGLSICKRLVAAMGGEIWAESQLGKGATFAFTIAAPVLEEATTAGASEKRSCLLDVDGPATRRVLEDALGSFGYMVLAGADAGSADLVVASSDRIESIASRATGVARPLVICVAGVGDGRVEKLIAAGAADGVLLHPISSGRVREILRAIEAGALAQLLQQRTPDSSSQTHDLAGLDVLVADDSPVNREVVSEALARLGAKTTTVEDGAACVSAFKERAFDIVLMDCSMPVMDGFAATRAIRACEAEEGRERTPIVALTAHVAGSAADAWQQAGMDDYLTKPFTIRSLGDCLARLRSDGGVAKQTDASEARAEAVESDAADEAEALDPAILGSLRAIAGGDKKVLGRVFGLFRSHAPARIAELREAIVAGDYERAAHEAHALKSPSLNIGARSLAEACAEIEERARRHDFDLSEVALADVSRAFAAVMEAIDREENGVTASLRASAA